MSASGGASDQRSCRTWWTRWENTVGEVWEEVWIANCGGVKAA